MVELYSILKHIDGVPYEDQVAARSWEEAEELAAKLGGEVSGRIVEQIPVGDIQLQELLLYSGLLLGKTHIHVNVH